MKGEVDAFFTHPPEWIYSNSIKHVSCYAQHPCRVPRRYMFAGFQLEVTFTSGARSARSMLMESSGRIPAKKTLAICSLVPSREWGNGSL